jgi:hypothetical protein
LQEDLGEALTSQGVSTILGNVPTGIVAIRVEIDGTIQTERNVATLDARSIGESLELDQKDFLGGALKILVVELEIVVLHAVVGLLCDSSRQDGRRPRYHTKLHVSLCGGVARKRNG